MATGIRYVGNLSGGAPRIGSFTMLNDANIAIGQFVSLSSNELKAGTTNDTAFIGVAIEAKDNADDGSSLRAICNPDAIYAYFDGTAHAAGATLDLSADGKGLATTSNADFTVIADNAATVDTLFIVTPGEHYLHLTG